MEMKKEMESENIVKAIEGGEEVTTEEFRWCMMLVGHGEYASRTNTSVANIQSSTARSACRTYFTVKLMYMTDSLLVSVVPFVLGRIMCYDVRDAQYAKSKRIKIESCPIEIVS
jgi:hypothetical protein